MPKKDGNLNNWFMDKTIFKKLVAVHGPHCISIYLPRTRTDKDRITLKNQLAKVQRELIDNYHIDGHDAASLLQPVTSRLSDSAWWREGGSGIGIFVNNNEVTTLSLPHQTEPLTYIADHFYLLPLAPIVGEEELRLYVMTLSADEAVLFEVTPQRIERSSVTAKLPSHLEAVVGRDVKQKSLQYRSGQGEAEGGMFHGHGSGSEEEKKAEYRKYFRAIDNVLNDTLTDHRQPLVLACVDYLFPLYQQMSRYPSLYDKPLVGNYDSVKPHELHDETQKIFDRIRKDRQRHYSEQFQESLNVKKSSFDPDEIIPGALGGKIEALFVKKGNGMWGRYDALSDTVQIDTDKRVDNSSLVNLAAIHTVQNGGRVFTVDEDEMPAPNVTMNAVFRYQAA